VVILSQYALNGLLERSHSIKTYGQYGNFQMIRIKTKDNKIPLNAPRSVLQNEKYFF
jgi:hypothetical protein